MLSTHIILSSLNTGQLGSHWHEHEDAGDAGEGREGEEEEEERGEPRPRHAASSHPPATGETYHRVTRGAGKSEKTE